jgi:hypothetical protein
MADTVETLPAEIAAMRAEIDALRAELADFKAYALPVIDGHQPKPDPWPPAPYLMFPEPPGPERNP